MRYTVVPIVLDQVATESNNRRCRSPVWVNPLPLRGFPVLSGYSRHPRTHTRCQRRLAAAWPSTLSVCTNWVCIFK